MDENALDAGIAEIVLGLVQVRRRLDPETYRDLLGAIMVEIEQGQEIALERAHRPRTEGNVVRFPCLTLPRVRE